MSDLSKYQELKKQYDEAEESYNTFFKEQLGVIDKTFREMLNIPEVVKFEVSSRWSKRVYVEFEEVKDYGAWSFSIEVRSNYSNEEGALPYQIRVYRNSYLPTEMDVVSLEAQIMTDNLKQIGWYSSLQLICGEIFKRSHELDKLRNELEIAKLKVDEILKENKVEKYFNVIKPGHIITMSGECFYVVQNIARVNVHVIYYQGYNSKKLSIKKDAFVDQVE